MRRRSAQTTPTWPRPSTAWPSYTRSKANTPTPRGSTSARWRSRKRRSAPDHPDVAATLGNLANVYNAQGKYADAEALLQARAGDRGKGVGADHPAVANTLNSLAGMYVSQGNYADAEALTSAPWRSRRRRSAQPPRCGSHLNNLAILSASRGNSEDALAYSRKATAAVIAHAATETTGAQHKEGTGGLVEQRTNYFVRHVANLAAAAQKRHRARGGARPRSFRHGPMGETVRGRGRGPANGPALCRRHRCACSAGARASGPLRLLARPRQGADRSAFASRKASRTPPRSTHCAESLPRPRASSPPSRRGLNGSFRTMRRWRARSRSRPRRCSNCSAPTRRWSSSCRRQGELRLCADARGFRVEDDRARREASGEKVAAFRRGLDVDALRCGLEWRSARSRSGQTRAVARRVR